MISKNMTVRGNMKREYFINELLSELDEKDYTTESVQIDDSDLVK